MYVLAHADLQAAAPTGDGDEPDTTVRVALAARTTFRVDKHYPVQADAHRCWVGNPANQSLGLHAPSHGAQGLLCACPVTQSLFSVPDPVFPAAADAAAVPGIAGRTTLTRAEMIEWVGGKARLATLAGAEAHDPKFLLSCQTLACCSPRGSEDFYIYIYIVLIPCALA